MDQEEIHMNTDLAVSTPVPALIGLWEDALQLDAQAGQLSETSAAIYRRGMNRFYTWLFTQNVDVVSPTVIKQWMAAEKDLHKPSSVNTWYAGVKRFFTWAVGEGLLLNNPTEGVKNVKRRGTNKRHLRDALTDREVLRILAAPDRSTDAGKRDYAILCLMAFCALRQIEVQRLDVDDLSTVDGLPVLRITGKGAEDDDEIAVIAHPRAQDAIYEWLAVHPTDAGAMFVALGNRSRNVRLSLRSIRGLVKGYYKSAGVKNGKKTTHSLRHSAITKVAKKDIMKAQQVARHVNINTTMIYVHEADRLDDPGEAFIDYVNGNGGE